MRKHALDRMVQLARQARLDTGAEHYRPDLANSLPDHTCQFRFVFVQALRGQVPWFVALPFGINLVANLAFTTT